MSASIREMVKASYSPFYDNFNRLRVSQPKWLMKVKQLYDQTAGSSVNACVWDDQQVSGSGTSSTHNTNQASVTISVSALTAGSRARQTFRRPNYQPGSSHYVGDTFVIGPDVAGVTKEVGCFDDRSGFLLRSTSAGLAFVRRTYTSGAAVEEVVPRASWDIDPLDGSGLSRVRLDQTKGLLMIRDYGWFGSGTFRIGFQIDGVIYWAHRFEAANKLSVVYVDTPNLPCRYQITADGSNTSGASITHECLAVATEAGDDTIGHVRSADRGMSPLAASGSTLYRPVIAIRLKAGFGGVTVRPRFISLGTTTNAFLNWRLILNPTVTGTAFDTVGWSAVVNSAVEACVATTNATSVTVGTAGTNTSIGPSGYYTVGSDPRIELGTDEALGMSIAGTSDILCLAVRANSNESLYGAITWLEQQ